MRERPLLMSGPLVRPSLDGTKTQTRKPIQSPAKNMQREGMKVIQHREPGDPWYRDHVWSMRGKTGVWGDYTHERFMELCPYGVVGDRLWVREAHAIFDAHGQHRADGERWGPWGGLPTVLSPDRTQIAYFREGFDRTDPSRWRPSIHMPRWASRLSLVITDVRVERVQSISEEDARAEGVEVHWDDGVPYYGPLNRGHAGGYRDGFQALWGSVYGADSWGRNDWVWAISFEREVSHAS